MPKVRATRAYVAGLGTAGSLLAGAAVLFVIASAVVSFRGWPQVGAQPSAVSVGVSPSRVASSSSTTRRLLAAVAATRTAARTSAAVGSGRVAAPHGTAPGTSVTIISHLGGNGGGGPQGPP